MGSRPSSYGEAGMSIEASMLIPPGVFLLLERNSPQYTKGSLQTWSIKLGRICIIVSFCSLTRLQ